MISPETPIGELEFLPTRAKTALSKVGFVTAADLLRHYPRRYEDRSSFDAFPQSASIEPVCLRGMIVDTQLKRLQGKRSFFEITIEDRGGFGLGGTVTCRWFNVPWMHKSLAVGLEVVLYGRPKEFGNRISIDQPEYEIVKEGDNDSAHLGRIVPVYPLREGLGQRTVRQAIFDLTSRIDYDAIPDVLREPSSESEFAGMSRAAALRQIHFPPEIAGLENARRYLALEEFFGLQLNVLLRKRAMMARPGARHCGSGDLLNQFLSNLPFTPTDAQTRCVEEIRTDLDAPVPMGRLLQGDVGSGKTLVAAAAIMLCVEAGYQAAVMAPTQILAEQHYLTMRAWFAPLGITVGLRTGSKKKVAAESVPACDGDIVYDEEPVMWQKGKKKKKPKIVETPPDVIIGTHALLFGKAPIKNLGLVVIDEQHKFGVAQRAKLAASGDAPDVLVMTATPIPRTLTMTVYGDLDVSIIDELPKGRSPIVTGVRAEATLADVTKFIKTHLKKGRQAYIVYPLVEESETLTAKAATAEFDGWENRLKPHPCGLLHGRIHPNEKEEVMTRFREAETEVLVATTVIEVGVDVPNATVMVIYNAERFGLAQLHQLRGRVGRGAHKSYCILVPGKKNDPNAIEKLSVLEETTDGFKVAEADLKLRGPGDVLGLAQSGQGRFHFGDLLTDTALVRLARRLAWEILREDPTLRANPQLHGLIEDPTTVAGTTLAV